MIELHNQIRLINEGKITYSTINNNDGQDLNKDE
jgi:hypothetical protein